MTKNNNKIEIIFRERTDDIRDTTYCKSCHKNSVDNIGKIVCVMCGKNK